MRIALGIEYDGSAYFGWQRQEALPSVQSFVEQALMQIAQAPIQINCAGRTDRGVHATAQVVHFDSPVERPEQAWVQGVNSHLPQDIKIIWAKTVADDFHARFSATARAYRYLLLNRPLRPALHYNQVSWEYRSLDIKRMQQAAPYFLGEQDFSSVRGAGCQSKTAMRNVHHVKIKQQGDLIIFDIKANAFLLHMIRNMVGVFLDIGAGEQEPMWAESVLALKDRTASAATAPPQGLYLTQVIYPETAEVPSDLRLPLLGWGPS